MHSRSITFSQGVALYMGAVLGSGILILPGYTATVAGPSSILSWIILSLLSIPLAYTFARLALKYKDFGGVSTIVQKAFGYKWSAIVGWFFFAWVATGQAVVGITGAGYIVHIFHLSEIYLYLIGLLFLFVAFIINIKGIKTSGLFSLWLSGGVLILLIVTIFFAFPEIDRNNFLPFAPFGLTGIGQSCVLIFWAFFGWESITHLVPEFKNPERDVMRSTWVSVLLIGIIYTLLSIVTVGTHTYGNTGDVAPLAVLMNKTLGLNAGVATAIVSCVVCLGTLNVFLASSSRLGYALAKEGKFPLWFNKMSNHHVPYRATFFLFFSNALTILASYVFKVPVDELILIPTTLGIFVYIIASLACLKLLWYDRIGRFSALLSVSCCILIAPFAFSYLIVPIIISIACLLFLRVNPHRTPNGHR
ncbi:amino acid permease [Aneurinibacillus migulanus]|uniref:APC family permease n=1 Tax=Aneurinibacillus migulanus TaxID=47500 RepID=UPI002E1B2A7D|nr:amino acid permease [Aneurinibacillus migulanus]MED4732284.1 amino acid permease [Aneurinibacillus migulanus]